MSNAVLSVGSNLGDRLAYLRSALDRMQPYVDAVSPVYETPPWGPVSQPDYLNAVILASDETADPLTGSLGRTPLRTRPAGFVTCAGDLARSTSTCRG